MSTLRLTRDSGYADRIRAYRVFLDEKKIGEIRNGENKEFSVSPGQHELSVRIDWAGSKTVQFMIGENEAVTFRVKSNLRGARFFSVLRYVSVARNSYLLLDRVA